MLETVREYAVERLEERSDASAVRARHAQYYRDVAERAERELRGPCAGPLLRSLDAERENIRAALAFSTQHGNPETALRLGAALWRYWQIRGELREPRQRLEEVLGRIAGEPSTPARATGQAYAGRLANFAGDHAAARPLPSCARCPWARASRHRLHASQPRHGPSRRMRSRARAAILRRGADDRPRDWRAPRRGAYPVSPRMGGARQARQRAGARTARGEPAADDRRAGPTRDRHRADRIAAVAADLGDRDRARRMLQWSLSITRELGDVCLLPAALSSPGLIAHAEGDLVAARDSFVAALDVHREWATGQACCPSSNGLQVWPRAEKAVRLFAAVAALREAVGWGRTPLERSDAEAEIAALRARIPRDVCAAAWADGEAMTLEQALEHAGPLA